MNNSFILKLLKVSFELEVLNRFEVKEDEIIVLLTDGTKASIKTKFVA